MGSMGHPLEYGLITYWGRRFAVGGKRFAVGGWPPARMSLRLGERQKGYADRGWRLEAKNE
jgi:hypothetical protein